MQEITLVRLPVQLSKAVDKAVKKFYKEHREEKVEIHDRWHDADLWIIFADEPQNNEPGFVTRRVTVGAYSDDPDRLAFIPDITRTTPQGRQIQPMDKRAGQASLIRLSVPRTMQSLWSGSEENEKQWIEETQTKILDKLEKAWERSLGLVPEDASELLL